MNPFGNTDFTSFLNSFSDEEIDFKNKQALEENRRFFKAFKKAIKKHRCVLCGAMLHTFDVAKPCFHWFTYPHGMKKKYFEQYLKTPISVFQLESYFRWLASTEKSLGNINDLSDEISSKSYLEVTVKYKNIEWAISLGHSDLQGHKNSHEGAYPHYHIQMKVDERIFLKFNDYHIKLTESDLFSIALLQKSGGRVIRKNSFGEGMNILEDQETLERLDPFMKVANNEETATFRRQTLISAPEGQTISGKLVLQAMEESKITKEPVGRILQRLIPDGNSTTIIQAGDGVPNMVKRSGKD